MTLVINLASFHLVILGLFFLYHVLFFSLIFRLFPCAFGCYCACGTSTNCGDFPICIGNFCTSGVRIISTTKCGAFRFLLGIFVHATYVPFQPASVGHSVFSWEFSCTRRTYHFNYQVWGFPVSFGNFRARDVRTIFNYQVWGFPVSLRNFHARDVHTMAT